MGKLYLGVSIDKTTVKFGIVDERGHILCKEQYYVTFDQYETPILTSALKSTDKFLYVSNLFYSDLSGIGISATDQVDASKLREAFFEKYQLPVTLLNDAGLAGAVHSFHRFQNL